MRQEKIEGLLHRGTIIASLIMCLVSRVYATGYYISSSEGFDGGSGTSAETAWQTFAPLSSFSLLPGDSVLLKRGDNWTSKLLLIGDGTAVNPITLGTYGTGARPIISRLDVEYDICVELLNPSGWKVTGIDCRNAKLGLYLRYLDDFDNADVEISDCYFEGMNSDTVDPLLHSQEFAWSCAIWLGGRVSAANEWNTVVSNINIHNCEFRDCLLGFGTDWYWPARNKTRVRNVNVSDCLSVGASNGGIALNCVEGGTTARLRSIRGGGSFAFGVTAGFLASVKDYTIEDCEFSECRREDDTYDGVGFDFEGDCDNVVFRNNVIHDNDGAGIMVMNFWNGNPHNNNVTVSGNVFYGNCVNPDRPEATGELLCWNAASNGTISNCGLYPRESVPYYTANWDNFSKTGNRESSYAAISGRPRSWPFDQTGDFEGWHTFSGWDAQVVADGSLAGTSTTGQPSAYSPAAWINTHQFPWLAVKMSQTQGDTATLRFITEPDAVWDTAKSLDFPIQANGEMNVYVLNMRELSETWMTVVTGLELLPTNQTGSAMEIAYIAALDAFHSDQDTDGDGLSDAQEIEDLDPISAGVQNPFDPCSADTTGDDGFIGPDGIPDGQNDWDGDGMTNAEEFRWGFNANDAESYGILPAASVWSLVMLAALLLFIGCVRYRASQKGVAPIDLR